MTTLKKRSSLPPKPTFRIAALSRPSNSFAAVDRIVSDQLTKSPPSDALKLYMAKGGADDPVHYARSCILFAGLEAWERAREWEEERTTVQANVAAIMGHIDGLKRANDALKLLAQAVTEREKSLPKLADPSVIANRAEYFGTFKTLLEAANRIEVFAYDDLEEVRRSVEARDYGRKDVLADQFIGNLARVWRTLFGEYPATSATGVFVDLADEAWNALGWGGRPSLGKKILRKATDECWSHLKRLDQHLAGTT